jgi:hypothetical protein
MILDTQTVDNLISSVAVAKQFGIESFIMYPDKISGISDNTTAAIFTICENDIGCAAVGINRLDVLGSRITLIEPEDLEVDCIYDFSDGEAKSLKFKSKKMKVSYRCANTKKIKPPSSLAVKPLYRIEITEKLYDVLNKSKRAMKSDEIVILSEDSEVTYKILDGDNDELLYSEGTAVNIEDEFQAVNFIIRYPIAYILKALQGSDTGNFFIMEKDLFHCVINGVGVYIPKKK